MCSSALYVCVCSSVCVFTCVYVYIWYIMTDPPPPNNSHVVVAVANTHEGVTASKPKHTDLRKT